MKPRYKNVMTMFGVAVLAIGLAACGGSSTKTAEMTPEERCTAGGGRWNADMTCTSAEDVAAEMRTAQLKAITDAIAAARTAVMAVDDDSDDAAVTAADAAVTAARKAIADASALSADVKAGYTTAVGELASRLSDAKTNRMTAMDDAQKAADRAMAATAAKLYAGISAPTAASVDTVADIRFAAYDGDAIDVQNGVAAADAVELAEDKDATVADNHGWKGKKYTRTTPAADGMYEAVVYSNVEAPKPGKKFGGAAANDEFEYSLTGGGLTFGQLTADGAASRIVLTGITRTAGTETFKLPDPNPNNVQVITVAGSFHGVSGTYSCDTGMNRADPCTAAVAAKGFTLVGTWTFKPTDANARVMSAEDIDYASYGWWLHKTENGAKFTASAFHDVKGTVEDASGLNALNGTATYVGGAAGKYALSSTTGGTNDAGHFTARATLEADFTNNATATAITGTIDNFMGADGMSRDWSVKLNGSTISDAGMIGDSTDGTEWTIGGTAAADDGRWSGTLRDNGEDGVPKVATGTFYSTYGNQGKMVGAFGATKQ